MIRKFNMMVVDVYSNYVNFSLLTVRAKVWLHLLMTFTKESLPNS